MNESNIQVPKIHTIMVQLTKPAGAKLIH